MTIHLHKGDLPDGMDFGDSVAIDSETMGLRPGRDRLCVAQLSDGKGDAHLVQFEQDSFDAPNLKALMTNPNVLKIFHFARFDIAVMRHYLEIEIAPVYCTKIASKLARTYTDRHGLKDLCHELVGIEISKQQQSSDWGAAKLSKDQQEYAATDVLHLHKIKARLEAMLEREGRAHIAAACFEFLPFRAELDLSDFEDLDIFSH